MVSRQDTATHGYYKELKLPCTRLLLVKKTNKGEGVSVVS